MKESNVFSNTRKYTSTRAYNNDRSPVSRRNNGKFQVGTHISRQMLGKCRETNVCVDRSQSSEANNTLSYTQARIENPDSQSSSSTILTKHVDKKLIQYYTK